MYTIPDNVDEFGIDKPLRQYRSDLRKRATPAEQIFWRYCIKKRIHNQVKPQFILGWYIVDFFFTKNSTIVELDGDSHKNTKEYDHNRDKWLYSCGATVLRFPNSAVENCEKILEEVEKTPKREHSKLILLRAISCKRVYTEIQLALKGLKHDRQDKLVPLGELIQDVNSLTKSIIDIPYRKNPKCPECGQRIRILLPRCVGCGNLIRIGWVNKSIHQAKIKDPIRIKRGRIKSLQGSKRPRCPYCDRGLAQNWSKCLGCNSPIIWED